MKIDGYLDSRFSLVADAFMEGFRSGRDLGAAAAVIIDGMTVVDVWHGHADRGRKRPWASDTLVCQFSVTKALATVCVLQAIDRGLFSLDQPVIDVWPEFAAFDKDAVTVRHLLAHRAGMIGFHHTMPADLFYDWDRTVAALAAERPWWEPGSSHGYHARTFGFLLGETLRRASGSSLAQWLRREVTGPCNADFHIGLTDVELRRCADIVPARMQAGEAIPAEAGRLMKRIADRGSLAHAAFQNPTQALGYMNSEVFRRAELPSANGHGTALATARVLDRLSALISTDLLAEATSTQSEGHDAVLGSPTRFGLGFMLHDQACPMGRQPGAFGHAGAGGSVAFHDPALRLSVCFAMNQIQPGVIVGGTSAAALTDAVYECIEEGR